LSAWFFLDGADSVATNTRVDATIWGYTIQAFFPAITEAMPPPIGQWFQLTTIVSASFSTMAPDFSGISLNGDIYPPTSATKWTGTLYIDDIAFQ
jgi:hypothetical protein